MNKLRVLLADDHAMLRDGLTMLINLQPDMEIVAEAADGDEALRLAQERAPDLAILDVSMQKMNGAEVAEQLRVLCPAIHMLALTRHSDVGYLQRMLQAGVKGYVVKKTAADELIHAIRAVAKGETYIDETLTAALVNRAISPRDAASSAVHHPKLTARETEVLTLIAWGHSNKEIANKLSISIKTVESYKADAVEKLHLRSRSDILRYALSRGWLSDENLPD